MLSFMVVSTFRPDVHMPEVLTHVEAEKQKVKELQQQGRIGSVRMAVPQGKVFFDVFAENEGGAADTIRELPMAQFWSLEVFTLSGTA